MKIDGYFRLLVIQPGFTQTVTFTLNGTLIINKNEIKRHLLCTRDEASLAF